GSDGSVSIELNGHTIDGDIVKTAGPWSLSLAVSNGRINGDIYRPAGDLAPLTLIESTSVRLTNVTVGGISADPGSGATLKDSTVENVNLFGNISIARVFAENSNVGNAVIYSASGSWIRGSLVRNITFSNGDQDRSSNLVEFSHVGDVAL